MRSSFFAIAAMAVATIAGTFAATTNADACAGLIGSNGAVNLGRTTTLAAYHNGEEHYVTSFEFQGTGGGEFGTLIPLPGIPSNVEKGGAWTLQRLVRETSPLALAGADFAFAASAEKSAEVLIEKRIDALDITVLRGGGPAVATWAQEHGFRLSPDAPEVLDFYAQRSPIFLAAVFDGDAAIERGQGAGDGTPVHLTIPTDNPWVPLRILGLGKQDTDRVQADVFLLSDERPRFLPGIRRGLVKTHNAQATDLLLSDLRSDEGMGWVPESAWLTKISIDARVGDLTYDLAVDADGDDSPSQVAAGFETPAEAAESAAAALKPESNPAAILAWLGGIGLAILAAGIALAKMNPVARMRQ
jgi:hypothetical protein